MTCSSGRTNRVRKIVFQDGQTDEQTQTTKSSENLFVPFSHQTICPSETICSFSSVKTANKKQKEFTSESLPSIYLYYMFIFFNLQSRMQHC